MRPEDTAGFGRVGTNAVSEAAATAPRKPMFVAGCDEEAWIKCRILDVIMLSRDLWASANNLPSANYGAVRMAIDALAAGTAVEIIRTLGGEPSFINLPKVPS